MKAELPSWSKNLETLESGQDLSPDQAHWAMREILENRAGTEQVKTFLLAIKKKGESANEVSALVDEMYRHSAPISIIGRAVDTVGTGGDVAHTINIVRRT